MATEPTAQTQEFAADGPPRLAAPPGVRRPRWWELLLLLLLLAAHFTYARAFIRRSSFMLGDTRYYCLFDDAVISMQYARNWANGLGPVWNEGERVEGYTNFLWVAVMRIVHRFGRDPSTNCLVIQWIGEGLLLLGLLLTWVLGLVCGLAPGARLLAVALLAGHYVSNYWGLEGMETALLGALLTLGFLFVARALQRRTSSPTGLLILGITPLVRPDAVLPLGVAALMLFLCAPGRRIRTVLLAALALAPMVLHMLWRHSFYGEWLPNTYYLKATGLPVINRLLDGVNFTWLSLARSFLLWLIALAGVFFAFRRPAALFLAAFGVMLAYQVWVGGDAWPRDRFVIPLLPGMMVAAAGYLTAAFAAWLRPRAGQVALTLVVLALMLLNFNYSFRTEWLLLDPPYFTTDNEKNVRRALLIQEISDPDAVIAVSWAGAPTYFSNRRGVDLLGKSDAVIARRPADPKRHIPGHSKYDLDYSLHSLKPDLIATEYLDIYVDHPAFALYNRFWTDYLGKETSLFVRFDSDKVQTHRLRRAPAPPPAS